MNYLYNNQYLKIRRKSLRNQMSEPEQKLWYHLRAKNLKKYKFRRQFSVGNFILDFFCPQLKLAIEIDGDSHFINSRTIEHDKIRGEYLKQFGIQILRFNNDEVNTNLNSVLEKILKYLP